MEFRLTLKAPPDAKGFSIDYVFFSEEYEEYIGSAYNDKFYMILTAPTTTNGQATVINYTKCRSPNEYFDFQDANGRWCYIAINTAFSEPCTHPVTDISGTGFECCPNYLDCGIDDYYGGGSGEAYGSSTGWLLTSWPIQGGEQFDLVFHIHDTSDGIYDSEVILDNFRWLTKPFTPGTTTHK
jgi:hypothetical protein